MYCRKVSHCYYKLLAWSDQLKDCNIIVYPDKREYQNWNKTSAQINKQGFNIQCSILLENINLEDGGDLVY